MNLRADCHWARAALGSIRRHLLFLMLIVSKLAHDRVNASAQIREVLGGRGGMKLTNTEVMDLIPCQVTGGLISQIRAKMLEERKARASHEVVLTAQQVGALEDFFWSSRIARMLVALSRRDPDLKDDPRYQVRMGQKFFGVSLADVLALHDFEEPCFSSSPWHSERLGCIKELTRDEEPSEVFAVAYYVFLFGSKAFVQRLRSSSSMLPNIHDYIVVACAGCCSLLTNASECISDVSSWYRSQWPPVGYLSLWPSQSGGRRP